jgi:Peptide methionine sulfoxide reductase
MKFARILNAVLASSLATFSTTNAFSPTIVHHHNARLISSTSSSLGSSLLNRSSRGMISTTSRFMILDKLFGGLSGGSMGQGIVYDNLEHPGPELARAAQQGKTLMVSERDPTLHVATFAGGCFWGLELAYQRVPGVVYTAVGYTQGKETGTFGLFPK